MNRLGYFSAAAFYMTLAITSPGLAHNADHKHHNEEPSRPPLSGESIYNLKSKWTTQNGQEFRLEELRGKPVIAVMAYTHCKSACPVIIEDMKQIEKRLPEKQRTRFAFVFFSVDSVRDTPTQLKSYAEKRKLNTKNWTLFHGSEPAVRELAAVFGVRLKKEANGEFDHSNVITLMDAEGVIRHQQLGLNQDPKEIVAKALELK